MAQIREFESTTESYFILDGVSYPKVYEAMLDNGYSDTKIKLVGTNRDTTPLVFSTQYTNIRVDGDSFDTALEAISRLNQIVFSKGGGSGTGGATNVITEDSDTVAFTGNGTAGNPLSAESVGGGTTGDYIPLTGTEEGKPVTGDIIFDFGNGIDKTIFNTDSYQTFNITTAWTNPDDSITNYGYVNIAGSSVEIGQTHDGGGDNFLIVSSEHIMLADRSNSKGLVGEAYYGANYDDLTYVQKKYVDKANSYSTNEIKTDGTWIDGKPIYRKVIEGLLGTLGESSVEFIGADAIDVVISKFIYTRGNNGLSDIEFAEDGFTHLAVRYDNINQSFNIISKPDKAGNTYYLTVEYTKNSDVAP